MWAGILSGGELEGPSAFEIDPEVMNRIRRHAFLIAAFLGGFSCHGALADPADAGSPSRPTVKLADLIFQWEVKKVELLQPLTQLQENYDGALERLEKDVQSQGKLDRLLAVKKEREGFRQAVFVKEGVFPDLLKLREIYQVEHAKIQQTLDEEIAEATASFTAELEVLKKERTRAGEFEEALKVAEVIERLKAQRPLTADAIQSGLLWKFTQPDQVRAVDGCVVEKVNDLFELRMLPGKGWGEIQTGDSFSPPLEIRFRVATDSTNIRITYAGFLAILNHESGHEALQIRDPRLGKGATQMIEGKGIVSAGEFHEIEIGILKDRFYFIVDNELRAEGQGDYSRLNAPVGIGPAYGSRLQIHRFEVYRP